AYLMGRGFTRPRYLSSLELPEPVQDITPLQAIMRDRRSRRDLNLPFCKKKLGSLLAQALGPTAIIGDEIDTKQLLRAWPSAGALYPLDIYIVATAIDEVEAGVYLYDVTHHALRGVYTGPMRDRLASAFF